MKDMAGARMRAMQKAAGEPDPIAGVNAEFGRLCAAYANTPLAVVAVLEGTVMGGGFGLACVADVAIASDTAAFRLPETSLGAVPAQIAPFLVERLGYSQAKRLAVTGGRPRCCRRTWGWCMRSPLPKALPPRWTRHWPAYWLVPPVHWPLPRP